MSGPLVPGDLIGDRYEIHRYLGEGGMQFVYVAQDQLTDRLVALKTPKNKSAQKRFQRSAPDSVRLTAIVARPAPPQSPRPR